MKKFLFAAAAATSIMIAASAEATTPANNNNSGDANATATAGASSSATGLGVGMGVGNGGDASSVAYGGTVRSDVNVGIHQFDFNSLTNNLSNSLSQGQDQQQNQSQDQSQTSTSVSAAKTENANNAKLESAVNITNPRSPAATAQSFGVASPGTCKFGPGVGVQGIAVGTSLSLPIFTSEMCETLSYAQFLASVGEFEAAVQYVSARNVEVNKAVTHARTVK